MSNELTILDSQVGLIKRTIAKGATDDELELFLYQARRTGLDPLARQIVFQKFRSQDGQDNVSIITTIDGYRLIADRTGKYAGSDDYLFDEGLNQYEHGETGRQTPSTATVTVYKIVAGQRVPFSATAAWNSYYPGDKRGFMWKKLPYLMLGKCAEALALRKAFPAELSGLYTKEEMDQAAEVEIIDEPVLELKPQKSNGNGHTNGKEYKFPNTASREFFDKVQEVTGNYYKDAWKMTQVISGKAGSWFDFGNEELYAEKLSLAVDHARKKKEENSQ